MLSLLGLEISANAKSSSVSWSLLALVLSSEFLRLCQHCTAEPSAMVPQQAPKQLAEGWKIDVKIGQYVQDDRLQDTSRGADTGMDAYQLLQTQTSLLCSNWHSLKHLLPVCKDQLLSTLTQVQVNPVTHLFSGWSFASNKICQEQGITFVSTTLMLSVFQRRYVACIFFSTKLLPKSGNLGVYVSCLPLQRNQGSWSFNLDQHYFCHPVHWWLVLNSRIARMGWALLWNQWLLLAGSSAVSSLPGSCLCRLLLGLVSLLVSLRLMMYCGITSVLLL